MTVSINYSNNNRYIPSKSVKTQTNNCRKNKVSFEGLHVASALSALETNPILALTVIDVMGMVMPRTLIDLNRNKEELGHLNWDAGRETLMRELAGTAFNFFLPGLTFTWLGNKLLDSKFNPHKINTKACTNYSTLNVVNSHLKEILQEEAKLGRQNISVNELRQKLARKILENSKSAYSNKTFSKANIEAIIKEVGNSYKRVDVDRAVKEFTQKHFKQDFEKAYAEAMQTIAKQKPGMHSNQVQKEALKAANKHVENISKQFQDKIRKVLINIRDSKTGSFISKIIPSIKEDLRGDCETILSGKGVKSARTNAGNAIRDVFFATDDLVVKAAQGAEHVNPQELLKESDKIVGSFKQLKVVKVLLPFLLALGLGFTYPRVQNWLTRKLNGGKEEFPGVAGLRDDSKQQTVSFNSSAKNFSQANPFNANGSSSSVTITSSFNTVDSSNTFNQTAGFTRSTAKNVFADFERRVAR